MDKKLVVFLLDGPRKSALFIITSLANPAAHDGTDQKSTRYNQLVLCNKNLWTIFARLPHSARRVKIKQQRYLAPPMVVCLYEIVDQVPPSRPQCREDIKLAEK
jgi:hypothetical protein